MGKQNFRTVPEFIREKLKNIHSDNVVVACSKKLAIQSVAGGDWAHVGLSVACGKLAFKKEVLPIPERGRYSRRNLHGHVVVQKNLPKVSKSYTFEVPNFGDWLKGSHEITITRDVYRREFHAPRELTIRLEILNEEDQTVTVKFSVNEMLNPRSSDFDLQLLSQINLLQENVGAIGVFATSASTAEFLHTVHVDWELMPEGSRDAVTQRLLSGARGDVAILREKVEARRQLLESLGPVGWIVGNSGLRRYFGAKFRDDLVVFENIDYGNAVYVLFEDWDSLSKLSRIELMGRTEDVVRIVHKHGWELKLKKLLQDHLPPSEARRAA